MDFLIRQAVNVKLIGCSAVLNASVQNRTIATFNNTSDLRIQNCLFNVNITAINSENVAGLILAGNETILTKSRLIVSITGLGLNDSGAVAGLAVRPHDIDVNDYDLLVRLSIKQSYQYISGFLAKLGGEYNHISNISVISDISISQSDNPEEEYYWQVVGSLISDQFSSPSNFKQVSSFVQIRYDSQPLGRLNYFSGGFAFSAESAVLAVNVYVFGDIHIKSLQAVHLHISGLLTGLYDGFLIVNCTYAGNINVEDTDISTLHTGQLFIHQMGGIATHCQAQASLRYLPLIKAGGYIAGAIAGKFGGNVTNLVLNISICVRVITEADILEIAGAGSNIASNTTLQNIAVIYDILLDFGNSNLSGVYIGLVTPILNGTTQNISANDTITVLSMAKTDQQCHIGAIAGNTSQAILISNTFVSAVIDVSNVHLIVGSAFGISTKAPMANIFVAGKIIGRQNVLLSGIDNGTSSTESIYLDCSLEGNDDSQSNCVKDANWKQTAADLGKSFGYNESLNGGYPHLVDLPAFQEGKFVLPQYGAFSQEFYYIDANGMPFPKTNYQICRGACYGVYSSPTVRECQEKGDLCCIDAEKAMEDFPAQSCLLESAECSNGVSVCNNDAELVLQGVEYNCVATCPDCYNGRCQNATCICYPYHSGETCNEHSCDADSPACFGDQTQQCNTSSQECQVVDWCADLNCVHGKCIDTQRDSCVCNNLRACVSCDNCYSFGPDCSINQNECDALCGGHGMCRTPLTTICTCEDGLGGFNCQECAEGHVLENGQCICQLERKPCARGHVCVDGKCVQACLVADENCISCYSDDKSLCSGCKGSYGLVGGKYEYAASRMVATVLAAVFGIVAVVAISLGVYAFVKIKQLQKSLEGTSNIVQLDLARGKPMDMEGQLVGYSKETPLTEKLQ